MKSTSATHRHALMKATATRTHVRVHRRLDEGWFDGFALGVSAQWLLIAQVSGEILLNGFSAIRLRDFKKVEIPAPHTAFVTKVLRLRKQRLPRTPRIDLTEISALLASINAKFPLVTIHREVVDPDVAHIGKVDSIAKGRVYMKEIDPDARWSSELKHYSLNEITRVDFGGLYEEALVLASKGAR